MPVEVVRGFEGKANSWNMGQEGGFIAYMRGSIGDKPTPQEQIVLGATAKFDDVPAHSESMLLGTGKVGDDVPNLSESWTITNS
jgi:hypothetical protein